MRVNSRIVFLIILSMFITSCIYLDVKVPLDKNVNNTELGTKVGSAESHSILWLVAWGDSGTAAAAKNGGITRVQHLDVRYQSYFFGAYSSRETIAYGE